LLRESEDLSQGTDNNDLAAATFLAGVNFDPINKRADYFNGLRASLLVIQYPLQSGDLSAVELREIRMDSDLHVALSDLQIGSNLALASLQTP
jgi:hypothetical protein